jgi:F-type H+-transporting ATPase subunit alpha
MLKTYQEYIDDKHQTGTIISSQGFTAIAQGVPGVAIGELVMSQNGQVAIVNSLGEDLTELLLVERGSASKGEPVVAVNDILSVPCSPEVLGRPINPLGVVLDGGEPLKQVEMIPLERDAPPIYKRAKIVDQLITGVMIEDLLVPLGRGQREVVMGDAKSGKTSFLLQVLMHVAEENMIGIYVAIGKTRAEIKRISAEVEEQTKKDGKASICIIAASSSDSTTLQYLAPYAGMSMAEYFRDRGEEVFLILDDLGNHAKAYREIALLNQRLPGRDSYPGDIFYTHSRLLERAGSVMGEDGKGHTITLMPIIETVGGDVTGYVQTNLISMSDGHTLFDLETFYKGIRPAINIGMSVSRVGKQTQSKLQKYVASELRTMIAQYGEAKNFVRFGAELTDKTKELFQKGTMFEELIKQDLGVHLKKEEQLMIMLALLNGYFDDFLPADVLPERSRMLEAFRASTYDQLRDSLKSSAKEDVWRPLLEQYIKTMQQTKAGMPVSQPANDSPAGSPDKPAEPVVAATPDTPLPVAAESIQPVPPTGGK